MALVARFRAAPIAAGLAVLTLPGEAAAHGAGVERFDAPLPLPLLLASAGATVAVTALILAFRPSIGKGEFEICREVAVPARSIDTLSAFLSVGFLGVVTIALVIGAIGRQVAADNPSTVLVWGVWIHGLAILAIMVGSPWSMMSPWQSVYRGLRRLEGEQFALAGAYPARLGAWPALIGFLLLIGLVENLTVIPRSPQLTSALFGVYAFAMVLGSVFWGEAWLRHADPLSMFYRMVGRVAPISIEATPDERTVMLRLRAPWRGTHAPITGLAPVAFIVASVYIVSFDGFTETAPFQELLFTTREILGTGSVTSVPLFLAGLGGFLGLFVLSAHLSDQLTVGDATDWRAATLRLAPTLLPIAAAYEVAHNYPYVMWNLGRLPGLLIPSIGAIEPLGWLSVPAFWSSQAVLILGGHIIAVVWAHRVCTDHYGTPIDARRAHFPMVFLMVGFTVLSLWIVSQPVVTT